MPTSSFLLTNGVVVFSVEQAAALPELTCALTTFLAPYFWQVESGKPHFRLIFDNFEAFPALWREHASRQVTIRKSSAAIFNLKGQGVDLDDGSLAIVDDTACTAYHIVNEPPTITFYGSSQSHIHLYEFVRYSSLLIEEALGTMIFHATASLDQDACYLVLGTKGAGKTTAMLHLVLDHGHHYFSGDKVLVSRGPDGLVLRGWPDYPHIGLGTLCRFTNLAQACGVILEQPDGTARPPSHKELIDPLTFRRAVRCTERAGCRQVAALIFPTVSDGPMQVTSVAPADKRPAELAHFVEYPHQFETVRWHRLFSTMRRSQPADYGALLNLLLEPAWLQVTGAIEIPSAILNRRHG